MDVAETLKSLESGDSKLQGEIGPGVYAYGAKRPMGRIRAYSSGSLTPFAGRGAQSEFHLLGHVHVAAGKITRIEGFNGLEGERWAIQAADKLEKAELRTPEMVLQGLAPLRGCQYTGIR